MIEMANKEERVGVLNAAERAEAVDRGELRESEETYLPDQADNDVLMASGWLGGYNGSTLWRFVLVENYNDYVVYNQYAPMKGWQSDCNGSGYFASGSYLPKHCGYTLEDAIMSFGMKLRKYKECHNHDRWIKSEWLNSSIRFADETQD